MLFNSVEFALFLPIVFVLYWLLNKHLKWQNLFVVFASYFFYGWWDWRFLILIAFTSLCSWGSGLLINNSSTPRKWLTFNIVINLLILGIFKYFNFFVDSFCELFHITHSISVKLILPVGISFYTFQALSYSIDIYRKRISPTRDAVAFFAYVSFFPQLVAGPIERATNLLPQLEKRRSFVYAEAVDGMRRILWGLFKKIVIADNCAVYVDQIWGNYANESGSTLALAIVFFAFQIYGDFSGYSDIAIGSARLFGIRLKENFLLPYFSRNVAEFWKRWHISLNTWFVDYVYIPLGGSREGRWRTIRNTFIIFLLSGLWHGANWTYVTWGFYHAFLFIPLILLGRTKTYKGVASGKQIPQMLFTFVLVTIGWIIFRAPSIADAWSYIGRIADKSLFNIPSCQGINSLFLTTSIFVGVEWFTRKREHALELSWCKFAFVRYIIYTSILLMIFMFGGHAENFIYFQF